MLATPTRVKKYGITIRRNRIDLERAKNVRSIDWLRNLDTERKGGIVAPPRQQNQFTLSE